MANPMLGKMMELLVHHYNLTGALSREAAAKGYGLDPEPYKHPYPGSTNYSVNLVTPGEAKAEAKADLTGVNLTTPTKPNNNWLPWLLGGGLVGIPLLVLGGLLAALGFMPKPQPAGPAPIFNVPPQQGLEAQVEVEWGYGKGPNGTYGARYRLGPDKEWIQLPGPTTPK